MNYLERKSIVTKCGNKCRTCRYSWEHRNRHNRRAWKRKMYWRAYRLNRKIKCVKKKIAHRIETGEMAEDLKTLVIVVLAFTIMGFVAGDMIRFGIW